MFLFGGSTTTTETTSTTTTSTTADKNATTTTTAAKSYSPLDILKLPGKLVGAVVENVVEKPLNLVADVVSGGQDHNIVGDALTLPGKVMHTVVEGVLEKPIDAVTDALTPEIDAVTKENPIVSLPALTETAKTESTTNIPSTLDVLKVPGEIIVTKFEEVAEKPLKPVIDAPAVDAVTKEMSDKTTPDSENPQQLVCTGKWELIPVLLIDLFYIIRNLVRTVLRFVFNVFFTILGVLESLLGIDGWLSDPMRNSVPAQVIWKSIQKTDLIAISIKDEESMKNLADLNPINAVKDVLNPANLVNNLNKTTLAVGKLGNSLLSGPLSFVNHIPIIGSLTSDTQFMLQIQIFLQTALDIVFKILLTIKEITTYPFKSLKTAFQKG